MSTVYVVTHGDYSGYEIIAVYDDETKAKRIASFFEGRVEEYQLNDPDPTQYPEGHTPFRVTIYDSGEGTIEPRTVIWSLHETPEYIAKDWFPILTWGGKRPHGPRWEVDVWAKDRDHAKKIGCDKIAQAMAEKAGITD